MKLAIQTLLLPGTMLAEQFDAAARFGFDAVELAAGPDFDVRERFNEIERASAASGLPVSDPDNRLMGKQNQTRSKMGGRYFAAIWMRLPKIVHFFRVSLQNQPHPPG